MIDIRWIFILIVVLGFLTGSYIPGTVVAAGVVVAAFRRPELFNLEVRFAWCIQVALVIFMFAPYAICLAPHGGAEEQAWLNGVVLHLEVKRDECDDPEMKEIIDYTIRRYNTIGPLGVRVVQLPEDVAGMNNPFVMGVNLDEYLLRCSRPVGALILVHEAMHDYWPHFGHSHIDDARIWEAVK
jgi:hypothetical protein